MLRVLPVLPLLASTSTIYARLRSRAVGDWRPVGRIRPTANSYAITFNEGARALEAAWAAAARSPATRPETPSIEMAVVISGDFVLVAAVSCALVDSRDERAVHDGGLHHLPGGPAPLRSRWPAIVGR